MIDNIENLRKAIHLVHLENLDSITIDVKDLVMLERQLKAYEDELKNAKTKIIQMNITIANLVAEGLKTPPKLDFYA
jgi:hypothetical protein